MRFTLLCAFALCTQCFELGSAPRPRAVRAPASRRRAPDVALELPRDLTPLGKVETTARPLAMRISTKLDEEWIEQDDHAIVGAAAAAAYLVCRRDGKDEITQLMLAIGGALEKTDMGECFVGPWDIANMSSDVLFELNDLELCEGCG